MNKIIIDKEEVELKKITKKIKVNVIPRKDLFGISKMQIDIIESCDLEITYLLENTKLDIVINLNPNVTLNLYELKQDSKGKIKYTFNLDECSILNIEKFHKVLNFKEMLVFNLNGKKAKVNYNSKSLCSDKETYDLVINHLAGDTVSNIKNNAVNILEGKVIFQVSSYVPKGIKNCLVNQNNRIINFTNNKSEIRPNLYIDEYDTSATHSALIGGFSSEELFYIQSRGINEVEANCLLVTGFLLSDLSCKKIIKEIMQNIKEHWR